LRSWARVALHASTTPWARSILRLDRDDLACIDAVLTHAVDVAGPSPEMV
jgi:hypothetical protein